jgi:phosphoribosylformimino-5-aminoimidazole carboxamide ribotide isomerase
VSGKRLIPVIDVLNGVVVRAVAGNRHLYQPIQSQLTTSTDPVEVAEALVKASGSRELYIADLDAILQQGRNWQPIETLLRQGVKVWLDAGIRDTSDLHAVPEHPNLLPILGTETMRDPRIVEQFARPLCVSFDMRGGTLVKNWASDSDILEWFSFFHQRHIRHFILLDLQAVGQSNGPTLGETCLEVKSRWPDIELITGGGVRDQADVDRLHQCGADAVLVSTALHNQSLMKPPATLC